MRFYVFNVLSPENAFCYLRSEEYSRVKACLWFWLKSSARTRVRVWERNSGGVEVDGKRPQNGVPDTSSYGGSESQR